MDSEQHAGWRFWGSAAVSVLVLSGFIIVTVLVFTEDIPGPSHDIALLLFGGLNSMATAIVSYWVGASINDNKPPNKPS